MDHLHIADEFAAALAAAGLDRFDALLRGEVGELIKRKAGGTVRRVTLADGGVYYLRRVDAEPVSRALRPWLGFRRAASPCRREAQLIEQLRRHDIPVMRVAAWGERRVMGVPRESFLLTEQVRGVELDELFRGANKATRRRLVATLGSLLGRLHRLGYFQRLRLRDIMCASEAGDPQVRLVLIDRETTRGGPQRVTFGRCCDSLARCWCKLIQTGHRWSRVEALRFLRAYGATSNWMWDEHGPNLTRNIQQRAQTLTAPGGKYQGLA